MKQQNTTAMRLPENAFGDTIEKNTAESATAAKPRSRLKRFFENLFALPPRQLTQEDWKSLEFRRSPQAIRADARREGIL